MKEKYLLTFMSAGVVSVAGNSQSWYLTPGQGHYTDKSFKLCDNFARSQFLSANHHTITLNDLLFVLQRTFSNHKPKHFMMYNYQACNAFNLKLI